MVGRGPVASDASVSDAPIPVGQVHGVFGIRGWIKLRSFTRPSDGIFSYRRWCLGQDLPLREYHVSSFRADGENFLVKLRGVNSREEAESLVGLQVSVPPTALPPLTDGHYYWRDLVGLSVTNQDGVVLGRVSGLLETGANDVLVVEGERQRLIPFVPERYVLGVDLTGGQIVVDWHADD